MFHRYIRNVTSKQRGITAAHILKYAKYTSCIVTPVTVIVFKVTVGRRGKEGEVGGGGRVSVHMLVC